MTIPDDTETPVSFFIVDRIAERELSCQIQMKRKSRREPEIPDRAPDCFRCRHFKITWDLAFPRACLLFGLKCRNLPSMEVFISSGSHCFAFDAKEQK